MKNVYFVFSLIWIVFISSTVYGQEDYSRLIQNYLERNLSAYNLSEADISDLIITDQYYTKSMDLEHVHVQQRVNGIPVFNGVGNFAIKKGKVVYFTHHFEPQINQRSNSAAASIKPMEAVLKALKQLDFDNLQGLKMTSSENGEYVFFGEKISPTPIPVKLVYQPIEEGSIRLAWDISVQTMDLQNWWSVRVDAKTGMIISKHDWAFSCNFDIDHALNNTEAKPVVADTGFGKAQTAIVGDGSQYRVFDLPVQSPIYGVRTLVTEPADPTASPYGWHDGNGSDGAEYTTTRGNNVFAYEDRAGTFSPNYSPDGGASLNFDFPLDLAQQPVGYIDPAITNLFYMNNKMHDIWYHYGFDEQSGNFQLMNYSGTGQGMDYVNALGQFAANSGPNNNAIFSSPPDGQNPTMLMFTWDLNTQGTPQIPQVMEVNNPAILQGSYPGTVSNFGGTLPAAGITGDLVLIEDDNSGTSTDIHDGCDVILNGAAISGNIAVIRRGICQFDDKVLKAQNEGAIAVVMVNNAPGFITMAGDDPNVTIPSVLIGMDYGEDLISALIGGTTISVTLKESGPFLKDGDLDNSVIAHEYGHGISGRLTGGPSNAGCLQNEEQMGEGWSDFFGLTVTMRPGDQATDARGFAPYVRGQGTDGAGIRQFPYTTDMTLNPFTYGDVQNQFFNTQNGVEVHSHGVGSIWATMLWDLTWALIDKYGFDLDVYNGTGGNNIAMQLVIDGLKLQPCNPGFVDGRDAILQADKLYNSSANQCLIWEVFANRGLGYSADQGSSNSIFDQFEAFDMPPKSILNCEAATTDFNQQNSFQVYPNPANEKVNIASQTITGEIQVLLYNINGRKIMDKIVDLSNNAQIDVSALNTGIYVMHIISDGKTQTEKLIIQ